MSRSRLGRPVPKRSAPEVAAPAPDLPFIDEHDIEVEASPEAVWAALAAVLPRAFGGRGAMGFARGVGCEEVRHEGVFPDRGAKVIGFHVAASDPPRLLSLRGRHRFARYELAFHIEPDAQGTRLRAVTRAVFPGFRGWCYRTAVIGSRGHVVVVRRLLRSVRRRAERHG